MLRLAVFAAIVGVIVAQYEGVSNRPGACPKLRGKRQGSLCPDLCQTDADCPTYQKCCQGPRCGKICINPVPNYTCANVKCERNSQCVMKELICVTLPCFPIPTCEPLATPGKPTKKECPAFPAFVPDCVGGNRDQCALQEASGCPRGELCCSTPCGNACLKPR